MLSRFRRQASPAALVISLIALFVAIGGVAGALQGKKSVDKNDLKKNVVKSKNVAGDTLTGGDIKESTLDIPASAVDRNTFGATVSPAGNVVTSTLPGTKVDILGAGAYEVTFSRSLQGCVPAAATDATSPNQADSEATITSSNKVFVASGSGSQNAHVIIVCP